MKLILTGYMGSGKTAVGRAIAEILNQPFLDLDSEISIAENKSISEIFSSRGEIYFRKREAEVLQSLLEQEVGFVLSLGGGTPCYGKNLQRIKNSPDATLVYLKTGINELKQRLFREKDQRPLIEHLGTMEVLEDFIRKHLFERTYYYNQSDVIVSTDEKPVNEIASEVIARLN